MRHLPKTPDRSAPIALEKRRNEGERKPNSGATIEQLQLAKTVEFLFAKIVELQPVKIEEPRLARIGDRRPIAEDASKSTVVPILQVPSVDARVTVVHDRKGRIPDWLVVHSSTRVRIG